MQRTQPNYTAHDLAQISVPVAIVKSQHDEFIKREHAEAGTELQMELTVEAVRHKVRATTRELPFFNPARKMATPVT